MFCNLKKQNY